MKRESKPTEDTARMSAEVARRNETRQPGPGRRRLIMAIAAAGAAVSLPARWTRPIVDAVLLPAHAQATGAASPAGPVKLTISGVSNSCATAVASDTFYLVDDIDQAPELVVGTATDPNQRIQVQRYIFPTSVGVLVSTAGDIISKSAACPNPAAGTWLNFTRGFQSLSGASWEAAFAFRNTASGVELSDIVLTPV